MRAKGAFVVVGIGLLSVVAAAPVWAHHAFAAEFDADNPIELTGTVVRMEWVKPTHLDPHRRDAAGRLPADVDDRRRSAKHAAEARVYKGVVTGGHRGFRRGVFRQGTDRKKPTGGDVTFTDGSKLFLGSSGTGAPKDGRDPIER